MHENLLKQILLNLKFFSIFDFINLSISDLIPENVDKKPEATDLISLCKRFFSYLKIVSKYF